MQENPPEQTKNESSSDNNSSQTGESETSRSKIGIIGEDLKHFTQKSPQQAAEDSVIKFKIRTLQSDLESKEGKELSLNLQGEKIETKKIELPTEKLKTGGIIPNALKNDAKVDAIETKPTIESFVKQNSELIEKQSSASINEKQIPQRQAPIGIEPKIIHSNIQDTSKESAFEKEERLDEFSSFEKEKKTNWLKLLIYIGVSLIVVVIIVFGVFWFIKQKEQISSTTSTSQSDKNVVAPIFVPPSQQSTTTIVTTTNIVITATTTSVIQPQTKKVSILPLASTTTKPTATKTELVIIKKSTTPPIKTDTTIEPKSPKIYEPIEGTQKEITPTITNNDIWLINAPTINIPVNIINDETFKKAWGDSLKYQKTAGSIFSINFSSNSKKLPVDFVIDYFINPTFINKKAGKIIIFPALKDTINLSAFSENFKKSIGPNYEIIYYFTHTRKFPMFIFEINDDLTAVPFLRLWDKETMLSDMSNIYNGVSIGKFIRKYFVTQTANDVDYRIAFKDDDYKLIWSIYNNKLIISTSISGYKILINKLQE